MQNNISDIHHITAIAGYGNETGKHGTILTFFPWEGSDRCGMAGWRLLPVD